MPNTIQGSPNNASINRIEKDLFSSTDGKFISSPSNDGRSAAVIISEDGVRITSRGITSGISVGDTLDFTGLVYMTSSGENIRKGPYSENPKSSKIFTYRETVLLESIPKELLSSAAGKSTGVNSGAGMDGVIPIMTDISAGPLPHMHTISMKHVHRLEPAYLYRVPNSIGMISGAMSSLKSFFSI